MKLNLAARLPTLEDHCAMHRIRAITLDLDDTLWAIAPVIERAERTLWQWLEAHYPNIGRHWNPDSIQLLREQVADDHRERAHDLRFLREQVLERMAEEAGYDGTLVQPAFRVFDEQRNTVELFPDVLPGLKALAADYRLVALTNGNACLDRIGIRPLFDDVVTAVEVGAAKPDARIFEAACTRAGIAPGDILHVGDHPQLDVAGARAAGLRTAWVNRVKADWPADLAAPDATVTTLQELRDWLGPPVR